MSLLNLDIHFNAEGWGPVAGEKIPAFVGIPYAHFDKKDKMGRAADFVSQNNLNNQRQYRRRYDMTDFAFQHDAVDEDTFQIVDTFVKPSKKSSSIKRPANGRGNQRGGRGNPRSGRGEGRGRGNRRMGRKRIDRKIDRTASVTVAGSWEIKDEFDLAQLLKLAVNLPAVEDLTMCGHLDAYDDNYDKLTARLTKPLRRCEDKAFHYITTSDDPIILSYVAEGKGNIYMTDSIISHLMASPRSVYSWDIVVQKTEDGIFFDKRNDSNLDLLTVNETAIDAQYAVDELEDFNHPDQLAAEATAINQNFSQQVLSSDASKRVEFKRNPFIEDEEEEEQTEPASLAYRYRMFTLGDIKIVARCEVHSVNAKQGNNQYMNVYALNEWDSRFSGGMNWRQKIDSQRGAVVATEFKNNSCKVAKWTAQSILAGAELMKIGYVSRTNASNPTEHVIIGTQVFKPKDLAAQINLSIPNIWGIIKVICDIFMKPETAYGKYVIMKDPNKALVRIFQVPDNTFEDEDGDDLGDEDEEDEEEGGDELDLIAVDPEA